MADYKPRIMKVSRACDRCKKQKLKTDEVNRFKCDVERPCTLCARSGIHCATTGNVSRDPPFSAMSGATPKKRKRHEDVPNHRQPRQTELFIEPEKTNQILTNDSHLSSETSSDIEAPRMARSTKSMRASATDEALTEPILPSVFSFNESQHHSATSALPGGTDQQSYTTLSSLFSDPHLPPADVVEALIDSYFDTVHWFMFILHEGSFRKQAKQVVALGSQLRTGSDADFAALLMMVIALGAQYAGTNPKWRYRDLMAQHSIDLTALVPMLIRQVRAHLLDSLERCQLEAVQTCILLGTYYIYHGNPNLSWSVLGLAVKAAYALGMHREVGWKGDNALLQARKRAWGHTYIADTFAAVIYGRPATVDRNFCDVSYPDECDDTEIPIPLAAYLRSINDGNPVSKLTYHTHKYLLYEIKAQIISKIYTLRSRASFQNSGSGVPKLVKTVQSFDSKLKAWKSNLPVFFKQSSWTSGNGDPNDVFVELHENLSGSEEQIKRHLVMQRIALQLLYDYILILLHRPLLEYRMSSRRQGESPESSSRNPFPNSFETCISAALRISHTPANVFEYNCPMALITMHMLTAGVILCIPATMDPFSSLAHEAKGAVVRMIRMFKKLSAQTPVVAQSWKILEELMKVVLKRELELVLHPESFEDQNLVSISLRQDPAAGADEHNENTCELPQSFRNAVNSTPRLDGSTSLSQPTSFHTALQFLPGTRSHAQMSTQAAGENSMQQHSMAGEEQTNSIFPTSFGDNSIYTVSPEGFGSGHTFDSIEAEPDLGFNVAFGALERVMYDVAPSEWMNPAWMHSYEDTEPYGGAGQGFAQNPIGFDSDEASTASIYYGDSGAQPGFDSLNSQLGRSLHHNGGAAGLGKDQLSYQQCTTNLGYP